MKKKITDLEHEISILRDPPFSYFCGYQETTNVVAGYVPYSSLFYSSTNIEGANLDISTGIFTSGHPGTYTVTWSLHNQNGHTEQQVVLYLFKNDNRIIESQYYSKQIEASAVDQGAVNLVLHLERGDTLALYYEDCSDKIWIVMFCVELSQFDVI